MQYLLNEKEYAELDALRKKADKQSFQIECLQASCKHNYDLYMSLRAFLVSEGYDPNIALLKGALL